ncbi:MULTISPECIES: hypothetical protein [Peribacillus]|uniref:hypothetical protein n=1 Tax=Peribacillus TaxID=2675229 RepID=UPI001F4E17CE|nr:MULTISPECIES: hypothetical protein [unclassified Peribacillus]MCK1986262.1 hypothetical protein [Peribacillus sp. Aquil_B1]MCK2010381.1 hypothetical protein [Peribacillus sp. Aquil_B8]
MVLKKEKPPVLLAIERDQEGNLSVWCHHCGRFHHHGKEQGNVSSHCTNAESPFNKSGYYLKKIKYNGKQIIIENKSLKQGRKN